MGRDRRFSDASLRLTLIWALLLGIGCSGNPTIKRQQRALEDLVAARGFEPDEFVFPNRLDDEMRQWLREQVAKQRGAYDRLLNLLAALNNPYGLDLGYEAGYTGTAEEVFRTRRYNCLSYSHLFLAMARELGIDVHYMSVDWVRRFRQQGDVVLVSGHVTVGYGAGLDQKVLQFNIGSDVSYRTAVPISDLTALALHYSNRGAELIQAGDLDAAVTQLEISSRLDPALPDAWVNLGVARRRLGGLAAAEEAYLRAIEIDGQFFPAYRNLATLFELKGAQDAVLHTLELLDRRGNRNPYAFLALGDARREQGRLDDAERLYRRALRLSEDRADALAAMGLLSVTRGELDEARSWLDRARRADPVARRVIELEAILARTAEERARDEAVTLD